jgi:recombinational DNA repair ATPase RecF
MPQNESSVTQDDVDKMFASFSQNSATIQVLEKQVQQTAVDIQDVKASFQQQLQTVITQNATMSNSIETLSITISRQNFVIACIQQEFKETMSDLYSKLNLSPPVITAKLGNPTAPPVCCTTGG